MQKRFIYGIFWACVLILFLTLAFIARAEAPEMDYEQKLDIWVENLASCESRNNPKQVNPLDNGSPSYGYVQYKLSTFWNYNKKYNVFPELTMDNLHHYVMQKDKQVAMTKVIIKKEYGWRNWYNCSKKIGLPPVEES